MVIIFRVKSQLLCDNGQSVFNEEINIIVLENVFVFIKQFFFQLAGSVTNISGKVLWLY